MLLSIADVLQEDFGSSQFTILQNIHAWLNGLHQFLYYRIISIFHQAAEGERGREGGGEEGIEREFNVCIGVNFIEYKTSKLYNPYLPVDHKAPTVASGPALQLFGRHRFHDDAWEALAVWPSDGSNPFQSAVAAGIGDNVLLFQEWVRESSTQ